MSRTIIEVFVLACGLLFNIPACTCSEKSNGEMQENEQPAVPSVGPTRSVEPAPAIPGASAAPRQMRSKKLRYVPVEQPKQVVETPPTVGTGQEEGADQPSDMTSGDIPVPPTVLGDDQTAPTVSPSETGMVVPEPSGEGAPTAPGRVVHQVYEASSLDQRLSELEKQNRELLERLKKLDAKVEDLKDQTDHETLGFGLGLASGLKEAKGRYFLVVDANLRYIFGCIYAQNRFGVGLTAQMRLWDVELRWLGIGVMYYDDVPALSVPEFGRSLDLMLTSGFDWRVWKGLEIRAQVAWFIPPPGPIYDKAWKRIEQAADEVDIKYPNKRKVDKKAPEEAWDIVTDAYSRAIRSPYLIIGVRWEF